MIHDYHENYAKRTKVFLQLYHAFYANYIEEEPKVT